MSPIARRVGTRDMMVYQPEVDEELRYLEKNLQRLTVAIPDMTTDEVPKCYQRHTTCISRRFSRLLRRVAQAIACYHEKQQYED